MLSLLLWQWLKVERLYFFTMIKCGGMTCSFVWKPFGLASKLLCSNQFNFSNTCRWLLVWHLSCHGVLLCCWRWLVLSWSNQKARSKGGFSGFERSIDWHSGFQDDKTYSCTLSSTTQTMQSVKKRCSARRAVKCVIAQFHMGMNSTNVSMGKLKWFTQKREWDHFLWAECFLIDGPMEEYAALIACLDCRDGWYENNPQFTSWC